jgi:hypothetical protein
MKRTIGLALLISALFFGGSMALAQTPDAAPASIDDVDVSGEISVPATPTGSLGPSVSKPALPGIPAAARQYVPDSDFVEIFCLTSKWKTGEFFAALDAIEKNLLPAVSQAEQIVGSLDAPDISAMRSSAQSKLDAICNATTADAASVALDDFVDYATEAQESFNDLRDSMASEIKSAGDALRAKIKKDIQPTIDTEKASAEAEMSALAAELTAQAQSEINQEMSIKTFSSGEEAQAYAQSRMNSKQASIKKQIETRSEQLKKEIEANVRTKVDRIVGPERKKFDDLAATLSGLESTINSAVASGAAKYDQYRTQAFSKRKSVVLSLVDKSLAQAKTDLESHKTQIDEARKSNSDLPSVETILSDMQKDRATLDSQLTAALNSEDETAFEAATETFRDKWEGYRDDLEEAFYSVSAICDKASQQLTPAKAKLSAAKKEITDLQARCATAVTDECLKVNKLSVRFDSLTAKMDNVSEQIAAVDAACQDQSSTDPDSLIEMLDQLKEDGDDLDAYGKALEAEKAEMIADSMSAMCAQALPQVNAAKLQLQNDELAQLESAASRCQGKTDAECSGVNALANDLSGLKTEISAFLSDAASLQTLCSQTKTEDSFLEARDLAEYLKARGEKLKALAKDLRQKQSLKASAKAVCRAAKGRLEVAKRQVSQGLSDVKTIQAECQGQSDNRCTAINAVSGKFSSLSAQASATLKKISGILSNCQSAGDDPADSALLDSLNAIWQDESTLSDLIAELKNQDDSTWPDRIKTGKPFKVILDKAPDQFDDSAWTGDWRTDPMGTIRGGDTYTLTYNAKGWAANGYNEGARRVGTWTYRFGNPDDYQLDIWGRVYTFDPDGNVYDPDYGLVGHLSE